VKAPRELVLATKRTLRTTAAYDRHDDAVETELVAQLASMDTPAFAELLAAMRARISRQA
jgi:enoyl-CoA hydratase